LMSTQIRDKDRQAPSLFTLMSPKVSGSKLTRE
jgi:hypothetical protein